MTLYKIVEEKPMGTSSTITNDINEVRIGNKVLKLNLFEIIKWYWDLKLFFWYHKWKYEKNKK